MKIHDVLYYSDKVGGSWAPWDLWRHEHDVDVAKVRASPLDTALTDDPNMRVVVYRYALGPYGWGLVAKQANFDAGWGPPMTMVKEGIEV